MCRELAKLDQDLKYYTSHFGLAISFLRKLASPSPLRVALILDHLDQRKGRIKGERYFISDRNGRIFLYCLGRVLPNAEQEYAARRY